MLLTIATFIAGLFGVKDILKIQRWMSMSLVIGVILIVLIASVLVFRSCANRKVKLNEKQIAEAQIAIAERDEAKTRAILIESDANEAEITATASNATAAKVNAVVESKDKWKDATLEEMAAELEKRK